MKIILNVFIIRFLNMYTTRIYVLKQRFFKG